MNSSHAARRALYTQVHKMRLPAAIATVQQQRNYSFKKNVATTYQYQNLDQQLKKYFYRSSRKSSGQQNNKETEEAGFDRTVGLVNLVGIFALMGLCGYVGFNTATLVVSIAGPKEEEDD